VTRRKRAAVFALVALAATGLRAEDERELGWQGEAELSAVSSSGNAESSSYGVHAEVAWVGPDSSFEAEAGALGASTTRVTRGAVRRPDGGIDLTESRSSERTAESYDLSLRYDSGLDDGWSWYAAAQGERNEPAGLRSRVTGLGGIARTWFDGDDSRLRTSAAVTLTEERPVTVRPGRDTTFAGLRFSWDFKRRLTPSTVVANTLDLDDNLERTSDYRIDTTQSLSVAMNSRLAVRLSLRLLYDHEPAARSVAVIEADGGSRESVLVELDSLDTVFNAALVLSF